MPDFEKDFISFSITINGMTAYEILASNQPKFSPVGGRSCQGMNGPKESAFLREILQKIIAAYPGNPVSLCVDAANIFPDSKCATAAEPGTPTAGPQTAAAKPEPKPKPKPKHKPKP
jgi:hypothetical protein